jgi:hypothetical protein
MQRRRFDAQPLFGGMILVIAVSITPVETAGSNGNSSTGGGGADSPSLPDGWPGDGTRQPDRPDHATAWPRRNPSFVDPSTDKSVLPVNQVEVLSRLIGRWREIEGDSAYALIGEVTASDSGRVISTHWERPQPHPLYGPLTCRLSLFATDDMIYAHRPESTGDVTQFAGARERDDVIWVRRSRDLWYGDRYIFDATRTDTLRMDILHSSGSGVAVQSYMLARVSK